MQIRRIIVLAILAGLALGAGATRAAEANFPDQVDFSGYSDEQLGEYIAGITNTDAEVTILDREALIDILAEGGALPTAHSESAPPRNHGVRDTQSPAAAAGDASITFFPMVGSTRTSLRVCRSWLASGGGCANSGGDGTLYRQENSKTKFGWVDTDGYYHPSNSCTSYANVGVIQYTFRSTGWIKLSGLAGAAWHVNLYCQ